MRHFVKGADTKPACRRLTGRIGTVPAHPVLLLTMVELYG